MPIREHVKWFNNEKGYGFIGHENGDIFAHYSNIEGDDRYRTLKKGDLVEFEIEDSERGPKAVNIRKVDP